MIGWQSIARVVALAVLCQSAALRAENQRVAPEDEIIVFGRAIRQIGTAISGSAGTVGFRDFENRSIARVGELAENVPGLVATQHSGTGKANQYFLRGFNLDHGTDLAGFVDGVPINMPSHGHGQGYLDLNFLIPELVERIDYRKGPYRADVGDFSAAGTISFVTADSLPAPLAEVTAGNFGYTRALAARSITIGSSTLLAALEAVRSNGPWVLDENLHKINALVKLSGSEGTSLSLSAYHADWDSTDQVPLRAIQNGTIDRRGFIDPNLGGRTTRIAAALNAASGDMKATAYATFYDFALTSNFTYFLTDPVNGDEFRQRDRRGVFGGNIQKIYYGGFAGKPAALTIGIDTRADVIGKVGLYRSIAGKTVATIRQDKVEQFHGALFGEAQLWPTSRLRMMVGLRADLVGYAVHSELAINSGRDADAIVTPKAAIAWHVADPIEIYTDYGEGYHSNDARGSAIRVDPQSGAPADRVELLVRARGAEIGARIEKNNFTASLAVFRLSLDSELVFSSDSGSTEPNAASRRHGAEATLFWRPGAWLSLDAAAAFSHSRLTGVAPDENHIPNAVSQVIAGGIAVKPMPGWSVNLRLRHFGPAPLQEDGSIRSHATSQVNLGAFWQSGRARFGIDVFNLLGSRANDISYYYRSRLQGEPAEGIDDYHIHPVEPRQARLSVRCTL
ncbi:TonB-dependent receptor [soil metagenome]